MDKQYTNVVKVFNRSDRAVTFTWDSRQFTVPAKGEAPMLEAAAWHGRKVTVYNLSVSSLIGVPVLGIVGIHDHEREAELPLPSATGEKIDRKEIEDSVGGAPAEVVRFSAGPLIDPAKPADSGRVTFSASAESPFDKGTRVGVGSEE